MVERYNCDVCYDVGMTSHASGDWVSYSDYAALLKELESKIALLEVQLKLSEAAERAWETSMMQACGEDGAKSVTDKFAELESKLETALRECRSAGITIDNLEAKCAALAAESEQLNEFISLECMVFSDNNNLLVAEPFIPETPATDAFLDEVRAQGVEMAMEHMQSSGSLTFGDCYISLNEFAAQLRKGGNQ